MWRGGVGEISGEEHCEADGMDEPVDAVGAGEVEFSLGVRTEPKGWAGDGGPNIDEAGPACAAAFELAEVAPAGTCRHGTKQ
jgi:hypothetical protein